MLVTRIARTLVLAFVVVAFIAATASADEVLEEIVVTADFRQRAAAELPPSISVLDRSTIEETAVQHFEELIQAVPNLNWSGDGHRARYFQIRGVGELEQYEGAPNPSVGFLIDDIDFSGIATIATLFDVQQIDVLRGPQGTRYGANALAGLVYVQTTDPTAEWEGRLEVGAGSDEARSAGLAFGGPFGGDALRYRLAAQYFESNGFRDNAYLEREDTNGRRESLLRGKLEWEAGEDWRVKLTTMWSDIDDGYDAFAIDNSMTMLSDKPGRDAQESVGAALRADWRGAARYALTSITSAADSSIDFSFDADWGNPDAWAPYTYDFIVTNDRGRRTVSQEFRLTSTEEGRIFGDSTDWLLGVYALRLEDELTTVTRGIYMDPFFDFELSVDDALSSDFDALSTALFGQLDIAVGDAGLVTVGLRGEQRDTDYRDSAGLALGPSESMLGGEFRYRRELGADTAAFVGLARGYKAGGFNLGTVPEDRREFEQEALWTLELGLRTSWFDDALAFKGTVFVSRHRDQQVRTSFQLVPNDPASFVFFTDNAASGRTKGLEASLRYRGGGAWEWYANLGLLRARFEDFVTPQVDLGGRDQAHAPRYTAAAGAVWRHGDGWFARVDVTARDEFYFDVGHDQLSEAYALTNLRAGFEAQSWSAELWLKNAFDERYAVRGFYFGNEPPDFPNTLYTRKGDPRHWGLTFELGF